MEMKKKQLDGIHLKKVRMHLQDPLKIAIISHNRSLQLRSVLNPKAKMICSRAIFLNADKKRYRNS